MKLAMLVLSIAAVLPMQGAHAAITYEVTDNGNHQFTYTYHIDDPFAYSGLTLFYDSAQYADLNLITDFLPDWLATISVPMPDAKPDPLDGLLQYLALTDPPTVPTTFKVDFTYLVDGTPGSQPYQFYDTDFNAKPLARTSAFGVTAVPEPSTAALLLIGALCLSRRRRSFPTVFAIRSSFRPALR